ncbi:MAG: multiubiquitin domain-containing protein [Bacteroidetes bacterium]|nr:multiubiquitin domain-containing protein [Bacteroidota bacterium]
MEQNHKNNQPEHKFKLIINETHVEWNQPFITKLDLHRLGEIPEEQEIFLKVNGQEEDQLITNHPIDLAKPGIERFYSQARKVVITIDGEEYKVKSGNTAVSELRKRADVKPNYDLFQVINGQMAPNPLDNSGFVDIKGGEVFISCVKGGKSA